MKIFQFFCLTVCLICSTVCLCQSQKVRVNKTSVSSLPVVATTSTTESKMLEKRGSFFGPLKENDIAEALEQLGINLYTIKLPPIRSKKYVLHISTDNYIQGQNPIRRKNSFELMNEDGEISKNVSLSIIRIGDSSLAIKWKAPDGTTRSFENPRGRLSGFEYRILPFRFQEIVPGKKIPILLLGSSWFDARINGIRFCSELEINPDLEDEAFKKMPQYYIFSIELEEAIQ